MQHREAAAVGVTMFAIGLGKRAEHHRADFTPEICQIAGRGSPLLVAATLALDRSRSYRHSLLARRQSRCQAQSLPLVARSRKSLLAAARAVPTYAPLDVPSARPLVSDSWRSRAA